MGKKKEVDAGETKLDWKDYIAFTLALLQTVMLPVLILFFVILAAGLLFGLLPF